jgi:hypothetical protein
VSEPTNVKLEEAQERLKRMFQSEVDHYKADPATALDESGYESFDDWYETWCGMFKKRKLEPPSRPAFAEPNAVELPVAQLADVVDAANALGRKLEARDMNPAMERLAEQWLSQQKIDANTFEFLQEMNAELKQKGHVTTGQAKGVLNCAIADARRAVKAAEAEAARNQRATGPDGTPPPPWTDLEAGIYLHEGAVYKVQMAVHGSGRPYAKRLVVTKPEPGESPSRGKFEYEPGAVRLLVPSDRMDLAKAKEFGAVYGVCVNCGATLTDETSIERGIGPICESRI